MNRRSFMKKVVGALVGVVGLAIPGKSKAKLATNIANIDPNSEWAKQSFDKQVSSGIIDNTNAPYVEEWGTNKRHYLDEKARS